jgi:hypothetical protein
MTCDTIQNRLLAHADPGRVSAEIRAHLEQCLHCQAFAQAAVRLERLLPQIPVPPASETAKAQLLQQILGDAPIIVPSAAVRAEPTRWERRLVESGWKLTAGLAAAVTFTAVIWWSSGENRPVELAGVPYQRHQLLQKEVAHVAALANANTPPERLAIWADVVTDLRTEAAEVYLVASESEIQSLGKMFNRAVHDGIIRQADRFPEHVPPVERQAVLSEVVKKLQAAEADADSLAKVAPPQTQPVLRQMAATAREGLARVEALQP